jgi:hypothetical protein
VLVVATLISVWVLGVNFCDGVEWLMNVSQVVDDETESEGVLVLSVAEVVGNLLNVVAVALGDCALEEANEVVQALDNVIRLNVKVVVLNVTTLIKVGHIDEMPG